MKKLVIISILALLTVQIFGQKPLSGGYTNLDDFKSRKLKFTDTFTIERRTQGDIKAWGGNDFKIESSDEHITKSVIRQQIWGIYKNDTLYLNGIPITGLIWYAKVEIFGKYSFLRPAFPINNKIQKELGLNDPQYGYMFGAIGGAIQGANMAIKRIPLIIILKPVKKCYLVYQILQEF